jgi:hypothetical protein
VNRSFLDRINRIYRIKELKNPGAQECRFAGELKR